MKSDDCAPAGSQPAADRRIASVEPAESSGSKLGGPVAVADVLDNIHSHHSDEARCQQENLERRLADQELLAILAANDFAGPKYERFEEVLAAYAISVLRGWMHSGFVFKLVASRGFPLSPSEDELEELVYKSDAREELANMTVAVALPRFREKALIGGGWRVDGGASLTTYFMGTCLYVFPNEYRKRRLYEQKYARAAHREGMYFTPVDNPVTNPATLVIGNIHVQEDLQRLDRRTAAVIAATIYGYSQEEIAELLNLPSARVVEGILYRWRIKEKASREEGDADDISR